MQKFYKIVLFLLLFFIPAKAQAIVNVEPLRIELEQSEDKFLGNIKYYLHSEGGNKKSIHTGLNFFSGYKYLPHIWFFNTNGEYEIKDHEEKKRKAFAHFRYNLKLTNFLFWEDFLQAENDRYVALKARYLGGTGLRFKIVNGLFVGSAYMYEYSNTTDWHRYVHRISNYLSLYTPINDIVSFSFVFYLQPEIENKNNELNIFSPRILSVSEIDYKLTDQLKSSIGFSIHKEPKVPKGIEKVDWEFMNSLSVTF